MFGLSMFNLSKYKESVKNAENVINGKTIRIQKKYFSRDKSFIGPKNRPK